MASLLGYTPIDVRDRGFFLIGFAGAFRRAELVAIDAADLLENADGLIIAVRRGKNDPDGRGDTKVVPNPG